MTHYAEPHSTVPTAGARGTSGWVGWIAFAGVLLFMLGSFHVIQGIVALVKDEYFLVSSSGLVIDVDYTAWGWTHIALGALAIAAAAGLLAGRMWARIVAIFLVVVSSVVQLAFLAAAPVWSVIVITLQVLVVYAIAMHGEEVQS